MSSSNKIKCHHRHVIDVVVIVFGISNTALMRMMIILMIKSVLIFLSLLLLLFLRNYFLLFRLYHNEYGNSVNGHSKLWSVKSLLLSFSWITLVTTCEISSCTGSKSINDKGC